MKDELFKEAPARFTGRKWPFSTLQNVSYWGPSSPPTMATEASEIRSRIAQGRTRMPQPVGRVRRKLRAKHKP